MSTFLRTPGQASFNYGLGTLNAVRPKGLFFVRFRSPMVNRSGYSEGNDFGYVVKSVDLPKVTAKTEEVNQYNKKRVIHTGYDLAPVTIVLNDTVGGTARRLWQSYLKYHYGDFNHTSPTDWSPDTTNASLYGDNVGYGYQAPSEVFGEGGRYFFETIDIFQVYAGMYTKLMLVNPRIQSFDPDTLDYEDMAPSTYRMTVVYETVLWEDMRNISEDQELFELFSGMELNGDPYEPVDLGLSFLGPQGAGITQAVSDAFSVGNSLANIAGILGLSSVEQSIDSGLRKAQSGIGGALSYLGPALSFGSSAAQSISRITSNEYDSASAAIKSSSNNKGASIVSSLVGAAIGAQKNTKSPLNAHVSNKSGGLSLSDVALGLVNASRSKTSQLGKRTPPKLS